MQLITVEQKGLKFFAICSFDQREIVKAAGFRWDPGVRRWWTADVSIAAKFKTAEAAQATLAGFEAKKTERAEAVIQSRAAAPLVDIEIPSPEGLEYLPYQRAGVSYGINHSAILFGDEMGLGKTIQAIGMINADPSIRKVLVICPASLKLNWRRELNKWLVRPLKISIAEGKICQAEYVDVTIMNYDILDRHAATLRAVQWDLVVIDEAHYLKNPKAKRTQAVFGREADKKKDKPAIAPLAAKRRAALTGTPIPNRPVEGWGLFHYLDPVEFAKFFTYALRYCDGHQGSHGWDFTGASNLFELQEKLRASFMVRRLKADVLKELPAKRRAVIELSHDSMSVGAEAEEWEKRQERLASLRAAVELAKASDDPREYFAAVAALKEAVTAAFTEMSQVRHDTAVAKIPYVIDHLKNAVEDGHKVVCFAHHHDVIEALKKEFGPVAVAVYGPTSMAARQDAVDRFQKDPECLLFLGGIMAAGVGLTLTASSHVVFAELDWVPGNVTQAEDRCHRIGQHNMVLVEHLVLEGSLDARMARILVEKQQIIEQALDAEIPAPIVPSDKDERPATETVTRAAIVREAATMSQERAAAILEGLRMLSAMDADRASQRNGMGFSQADTFIGNRLAQLKSLTAKQAALGAKLVNKYRRQLPAEVIRAAA